MAKTLLAVIPYDETKPIYTYAIVYNTTCNLQNLWFALSKWMDSCKYICTIVCSLDVWSKLENPPDIY